MPGNPFRRCWGWTWRGVWRLLAMACRLSSPETKSLGWWAAWGACRERWRSSKVHAGQTVLVHAGAGGVGYAALQIATAAGAKVFATVSKEKRAIVEELGAVAIDRYSPVEDYVAQYTDGAGFDVVYDTLGGPVLDASFVAVKRYTGHVVSCLGWGAHSLAPLSFRGATYSGVFTLYPMLSGFERAHHGQILTELARLAEQHELKPLLTAQQFGRDEIEAAYDAVAKGSTGKAVVEF